MSIYPAGFRVFSLDANRAMQKGTVKSYRDATTELGDMILKGHTDAKWICPEYTTSKGAARKMRKLGMISFFPITHCK